MILAMFPETGNVEIICPVKEAKFLAEITKPESTTLSIVPSILAPLLSTISMVPRALSHVRPNQSIRWQGCHIDFSLFVICDETCLTKIGFYCFRNATTHLAISFYGPAIVKKNSNVYALMSPMFFQRLKTFGENVRC